MKHWKTILAALVLALLLACGAAADNSVTQTTDEDGNTVTIVTDDNGNQTIISEAEPGENDITFDEDDLELEEDEAEQTAPAETPDAAQQQEPERQGSALKWILPLVVVVCGAVGAALYFKRRKHTDA